MDSRLCQMMTDEIGGNKSYLQEQEEYFHLRKRFITSRHAKIPGKEKCKAERDQRRNQPPSFPMTWTFFLIYMECTIAVQQMGTILLFRFAGLFLIIILLITHIYTCQLVMNIIMS